MHLLSVLFLLFCMILFSIWYFGAIRWWLTTASTFLVASMGLTAAVFAVASASSPPGEDPRGPSEPHPFHDLAGMAPRNLVRMNTVPYRHLDQEAGEFQVSCSTVDHAQGSTGKARLRKASPP